MATYGVYIHLRVAKNPPHTYHRGCICCIVVGGIPGNCDRNRKQDHPRLVVGVFLFVIVPIVSSQVDFVVPMQSVHVVILRTLG